MRLTVTTPLATLVQTEDAAHIRAEDPSGAFGILPGHAAFLTALAVCVLTWRDQAGREHHLAVRGGVLSVSDAAVMVATPEAVAGDDLQRLESEVLLRFRQHLEEERAAHAESQRLHLTAIRQIMRLLRPESRHVAPPG
jgi:F-type H+-transporting ATPase subunit epsilon